MSDDDREWTIEHAGKQLDDIISLLGYDETSADRPRPTRQPPNKRMARDFRDSGGGRAYSAALTPAGWRLTVCSD